MTEQWSSISQYLQEMGQTELLTAEQEMWLSIQHHAKGMLDDAQMEAIASNRTRPGNVALV